MEFVWLCGAGRGYYDIISAAIRRRDSSRAVACHTITVLSCKNARLLFRRILSTAQTDDLLHDSHSDFYSIVVDRLVISTGRACVVGSLVG